MRSSKFNYALLISPIICIWFSINFDVVVAPADESDDDVCASDQCIQAAEMLAASMDTSKHPCTDLHRHACGKFRENNRILPQEISSSHIFYREHNIQKMAEEYLRMKNDRPEISVQKARDYFASCMDEETIDEYGLESLQSELEMVGLKLSSPFVAATPKQAFDYSSVLAKMHRYALKIDTSNFMFNTVLQTDFMDKERNYLLIENTPVTVLNNGPFGEEDDDQFPTIIVQSAPVFKNAPMIMEEYITKVVSYTEEAVTGSKPSRETIKLIKERAEGVVRLLFTLHSVATAFTGTYLETTSLQSLRETTNNQLAGSWIKFDWFTYIDTLFMDIANMEDAYKRTLPVRLAAPAKLQNIFNILANTRPDIFLCTVWWMVVHSVIPMTTKPLRNIRNAYERQIFGRVPPPRNVACTKDTIKLFGEAIAHHMISKENGVEKKDKVMEMTIYIIHAFERRIKKASWLDPYTKKSILAKLNKLSGIVLFVDGLEDPEHVNQLYAEVTIRRDRYYENTMNKLRVDKRHYLAALFTKNSENDFEENLMNPAELVAHYRADRNDIEISLAFVGFPYYDLGLPSLNFGSMGVVIAHEISHSIGPTARLFDEDGLANIKWSIDALLTYDAKAACFVRSYSSYFIYNILGQREYVDGQRTLEENVADNEGFWIALDAYREYAQDHDPLTKLINFEELSGEQLFTLGFATSWCESTTPQYRAIQIRTDTHAPAVFRVNGVAENSKEFSDIWSCPKEAPMNPSNKCKIF